MIFEALNEALARGELLLADGGMCHFHQRRDGVVTIREILVAPDRRCQGIGRHLVDTAAQGLPCIARCPFDLPSNQFWAAIGFRLVDQSETKTGRKVNEWRRD